MQDAKRSAGDLDQIHLETLIDPQGARTTRRSAAPDDLHQDQHPKFFFFCFRP